MLKSVATNCPSLIGKNKTWFLTSLRLEVVNRKGKQKASVTSKLFLTYKQFQSVFREFGYVLLTTFPCCLSSLGKEVWYQ